MFSRYADDEGEGRTQIEVLPIPYEGAISFGRGASEGPRAILRASLEIETWDEELKTDLLSLVRFRTMDYLEPCVEGPHAMYQEVLNLLRETFGFPTPFVLTLGGDHSISLAPIHFYHQRYPELIVLQIDAHADLRDSFQGSRYSHGCVMARVRERNIPIIQIGIRSLCREESRRISEDDAISTFFAWDILTRPPEEVAGEIGKIIKGRPCYISFDVDGLDPSVIPGTGTPEPGGIPFSWIHRFWLSLFSHPLTLVGMDVVELAPLAGNVLSESTAVRCINRILCAYFNQVI